MAFVYLVPTQAFGQDDVSGLAITPSLTETPLCLFLLGKRSLWSTLDFWVTQFTRFLRFGRSPNPARSSMS